MDRLDQLVTPTNFSEKLQTKLGNLWGTLDLKEIQENQNGNEAQWTAVFDNIRQMLIRAASEPDFPIDFNFGDTPFSHYAKQMTNVDPEGKLKKLIVRSGTGEVVPPTATVYIFYKAYLQNEEYPFTSSHMHSSAPRRYQLGSGAFCTGYEAAIATMEIGEKSHFLLAPEIAYGKTGCMPMVPADAEILLEIELCDIVRHDYKSWLGGNKGSDCDNILKHVYELHQLANEFHRAGNLFCAVVNYRKAENLLSLIKCFNEKEEKRRKELLLKMIVNQIITFVTGNKALTKPREAVSAALRAFQHVPAEAALSTKLKYNLAKAYILLNEEEKALHLLKEARKLEPLNSSIKILHDKLELQVNEKRENEVRCWKSAHKKFPEHDSKEEYMAFLRNSIKNDLENYLENPASNIGMPWNYTKDERVTLCRQAERMNLVYEEYKSHPANVLISIHKRGSAMLVTERDEVLHTAKEMVSSDEEDGEEEGFIGWDDGHLNDKATKERVAVVDEDDIVVLSEDSSSPSPVASSPALEITSPLSVTSSPALEITSPLSVTSSPAREITPLDNIETNMDEDEVYVISDSDDDDDDNNVGQGQNTTTMLSMINGQPGCSGMMMMTTSTTTQNGYL